MSFLCCWLFLSFKVPLLLLFHFKMSVFFFFRIRQAFFNLLTPCFFLQFSICLIAFYFSLFLLSFPQFIPAISYVQIFMRSVKSLQLKSGFQLSFLHVVLQIDRWKIWHCPNISVIYAKRKLIYFSWKSFSRVFCCFSQTL